MRTIDASDKLAGFEVIENVALKKRIVGHIVKTPLGEIAYLSKRKYNKHYFHRFRGYGVSECILRYLDRRLTLTVLIYEEESERLFRSYLSDWFEERKVSHWLDASNNFPDQQTILPLSLMQEI